MSVVVSTYGRSSFLPELIGHLKTQDLDRARFEVTVVDNGSADDTWAVLRAAVESSGPLRLQVARVEVNRGPGGGRNLGVALSRGGMVAFTDWILGSEEMSEAEAERLLIDEFLDARAG